MASTARFPLTSGAWTAIAVGPCVALLQRVSTAGAVMIVGTAPPAINAPEVVALDPSNSEDHLVSLGPGDTIYARALAGDTEVRVVRMDAPRDNSRQYRDTGFRVAVGTTSALTPLPTLNSEGEIYVRPTVDCFIRTGGSNVVAAAGTPTAGASHPVSAGERFTFQVPPGHTHIAYICETGSGFLTVMPSA